MSRALSWSLVALAGAGVAVTLFWFDVTRGPEYARDRLGALLAAFALTAVSTLGNLFIRWARWHFLLRRFDLRVHTRDSVRLYFATLPAIATPLSVGELVRAALLAPRFGGAWRAVPVVWLTERLTDAALLVAVLLFAFGREGGSVGVLLAWLTVMLAAPLVHAPAARLRSVPALGVLLLGTASAWLVSVGALWATLHMLDQPLALVAAGGAFAYGTVLGGLAGIPLGTGVTGSAMILALQEAGLRDDAAAVVTAVFRGGTAWFAVALGVATFVRSRRKLLAYVRPARPSGHFDAIAESYADQIPEHIRERLLGRKIDVMRRSLDAAAILPGARGLDVGCGHGWYAADMARAGFAMTGFDQSADQVTEARRYAEHAGVHVELAVLDATRLPWPDATFGFAYSINVLHHIESAEARASAFREIVRVLKPGGVFFLHEINTENPLFRLYMGYLFPLLCDIDEGTERWIRPSELPAIEGAAWDDRVDFFTFLPDFTPRPVLDALRPVEAGLERSRLRRWSAHYMARLVKPAEPHPSPRSSQERAGHAPMVRN